MDNRFPFKPDKETKLAAKGDLNRTNVPTEAIPDGEISVDDYKANGFQHYDRPTGNHYTLCNKGAQPSLIWYDFRDRSYIPAKISFLPRQDKDESAG